ncbi:hypothetical protein Ahy_A01g002919 [Arachis hypogaea]|uniref:FAR1 domain-containing protein n=1 Tax=Arachis hypogaea TaxID=3818 RepID=A0A445ERT1_ARAHY|nr:hypothetical protein Ahy_A01g002919 [Arachis hypogaea]
MRFAQSYMAHEFYVTYAKKVGFTTKIRMTTCDNITKKSVNQAIHCNRDGFRRSRIKAPMRKNMISAARCKARIYVKFDKEKQEWIFFKVELRHSYPCSARKAVHYHEYRELTMHAKCMIKDNDVAGIRPNKTFLVLANEVGGPSNLGFSEKNLRNYITASLQTSNVNADVREMMSYFMRMKDINPNFFYAVNFDEECKFRSIVWLDARDVQTEFVKNADYIVSVVAEEGPSVFMKVEEEKLVNDTILCVLYNVHFDRSTQEVRYFHLYKVYKIPTCYVLLRWSKNTKRKHTYVKSGHDVSRVDESHTAFRGLCSHFYNVAQDFINDDDETALLHAALEETRAKLTTHRAKKRSESVANTHTSIGSQSSNVVSVVNIQGPSKVTTKGETKNKRLGAALEKSFKKSARRKTRMPPWYMFLVHLEASKDVNFGAVVGRNEPQQVGGFMFLLSSFDKS